MCYFVITHDTVEVTTCLDFTLQIINDLSHAGPSAVSTYVAKSAHAWL